MNIKMFKPPRELRFTLLGTIVVLLTTGIGLAAMNTGNNLVYMVFGMMLGFITASGILSEINLRHLLIDTINPPEIFAKKAATFRLILINKKKRIPSFCIETKFKLSTKNQSSEFRNVFLHVPAQSHSYCDISLVLQTRGRYSLSEIQLETQFPFGFFKKSLKLPINSSLIVYPEIFPIPRRTLESLGKEKQEPLWVKGPGESFWGIRHFYPGDSPRQISWKSSAKFSRLMVKETEKELEKSLILTLNPIETWRNLSSEELESAVSFGASYLQEKWKDGFAIALHTLQSSPAPSRSKRALNQFFEVLALFDPTAESGSSAPSHLGNFTVVELYPLWQKFGSLP